MMAATCRRFGLVTQRASGRTNEPSLHRVIWPANCRQRDRL